VGILVQRKKTGNTVKDHLRELRFRLFVCALVLAAIGTVMYFFYEPILKVLSSTLGSELYYSNPSGGFSFIMRICFTGAFIFTMPVIVYNIIMFVRPAYEKFLSTKRIILVALSSTILAISGAAFGFFCILPETINFFSGFQVSGLSALISADEYLTFVTSIITVFVIVFQVPLFMTIIDSIRPIPPKKMLKMEKWVVIISVVIAIITPFNYDVLSSLFVAVPIVGLYNLSIILILIRHSLIAYRNKNRIHSTIVKPMPNLASLDLQFNNFAIESIKDTVADTQKVMPITHARRSMEFRNKNLRPTIVRPIVLSDDRKKQKLTFNPKVRVFSDIIRVNPTSRVSTSQ